MTEKPRTQGERLARIETLLEHTLMRRLDAMDKKLEKIRDDLDDDQADLASLKSTGRGVLIGVAIFFTASGAAIASKFDQLVALLK